MASRKEEKERRRQERLQRAEAQQAKAGRARLVAYVAGGVVAVAAIVAVIVLVAGSGGAGESKKSSTQPDIQPLEPPPVKIADFNAALKKAGCTYKQYSNEGREHLPEGSELPKYKTNPPTSGNHYPAPAGDGAFAESPNVGGLIHSMEHGRVLIQYSPDLPLEQKRKLRGLFDEDPNRVLLIPNSTDMPFEVAATSWTRILGCKRMNEATFDAIRAYIKKYRDQGPELILQPE